jgi:EmrB/QacA subfamily drug resistance transporter
MKPPCTEAVIQYKSAHAPGAKGAEPWILAVTILGSSMAFIDGTVVNVALPALQASLGGTVVDLQWVVEAYALFMSALLLTGGSLGDLFGRRKMFLLGVMLFTAASIACGVAPNIRTLVLARAVQGVGAAFLVPGSLSIISASFGEKTRGKAIGTWSGFTAITAAVGPVLGGWLIDHASWRWAFFINVPMAVVVIGLALWKVPESRAEGMKKPDWIGAFLVTVGLGTLTYGLIEAANLGWSSFGVGGALGIGIISLIGFLLVEARSSSALVPLELFHSRDFSGANWITLFLYAALGIFLFLFPLNLIQVQHYSATATGAAALPLILLLFLLSRWSGGLITRYGPRTPLIVGPGIAAVGFALFAVPGVGGNYWTSFFPAFLVLGLGMAVSVAPLTTVVMEAVDQNRAGTASGINNAVSRVAGLLAVAIVGMAILGAFRARLEPNLNGLALSGAVMHELQASESKLAGLASPAGVDAATAVAIQMFVARAFVFGFRMMMLVCAGLSIVSAFFAWWMIGAGKEKKSG